MNPAIRIGCGQMLGSPEGELAMRNLPKFLIFVLFAAVPLSAVADAPTKDEVVATVK